MTNAIATSFTFVPQNFDEQMKYCEMLARSKLCPKDYINQPENVFVAIQFGAELGLKPMQALQSVAVINGRPGIFGDAALALVKIQPDFEDIEEYEDENGTAFCIVKRKGEAKAHIQKFGTEDAKKAGLWGKPGPWSQYPARMKLFRARGFALRNVFPHVLKGLALVEELQDYPGEKNMGEAQVVPEQSRTDLLKQQLGINNTSEPVSEWVQPVIKMQEKIAEGKALELLKESNAKAVKKLAEESVTGMIKEIDTESEKVFESVNNLIISAQSEAELKEHGEMIKQMDISDDSKKRLKESYKKRQMELAKEPAKESMAKIFEKNIKGE